MALSQGMRNDIKEYLIYRAKEDGVNPLDPDRAIEYLYDNWETVNDDATLQAQLTIDRDLIQQTLNNKKKSDLESQGYTVVEPE